MTNNDNYLMALKKPKKQTASLLKSCWAKDCPLLASMTVEGSSTCAYHYNCHFVSTTTAAIKIYLHFITDYANMVRWKQEEWQKQESFLLNHPEVPMRENEPRTMYLKRFYEWIAENIERQASAVIERSKKV